MDVINTDMIYRVVPQARSVPLLTLISNFFKFSFLEFLNTGNYTDHTFKFLNFFVLFNECVLW